MPSKETEAPALATAIISKFIEELAAQDGLADVAGRLRSTVLDQKIVNDVTVRAAMFADDL